MLFRCAALSLISLVLILQLRDEARSRYNTYLLNLIQVFHVNDRGFDTPLGKDFVCNFAKTVVGILVKYHVAILWKVL